jgi:hypothetical protein
VIDGRVVRWLAFANAAAANEPVISYLPVPDA